MLLLVIDRKLNLMQLKIVRSLLVLAACMFSMNAHAFFFFLFPLPTGKPDGLSSQIQRLSESTQTKALAYASEDKTFGTKYFVWGFYVGDLSQKEAIRIALERCNRSLQTAKNEMLDGQPRWNFGDKKCELYSFPNVPESGVMPSDVQAEIPTIIRETNSSIVTPAVTQSQTAPSAIAPKQQELKQGSTSVNPQLPTSEGAKRLLELKSLLDQGVITQQDYDTKKAQILKSM